MAMSGGQAMDTSHSPPSQDNGHLCLGLSRRRLPTLPSCSSAICAKVTERADCQTGSDPRARHLPPRRPEQPHCSQNGEFCRKQLRGNVFQRTECQAGLAAGSRLSEPTSQGYLRHRYLALGREPGREPHELLSTVPSTALCSQGWKVLPAGRWDHLYPSLSKPCV